MERKITISIVVRTQERPASLERTIFSLLNQQNLNQLNCEIIVVDNDPLRKAQQIVNKWKKQKSIKNMKLIYFIQPVISASKTANLGIEKSKGEIIAFIDDDAIPEKNWIEEIQKIFQDKKINIVGGKTLLNCQESKIPSWISEELKKTLGKLDLGDKFRKMKKKEFPVLMNFAIRREVFEKVGKFPEKLGYQKDKPFAGEETAFVIGARKKGYEVYYNPNMIVYHQITPERLKRKYFLKKKFWEGRALFVMNKMFYPLIWRIITFFFRIFIVIPSYTCLLIINCYKEETFIYFLCKIMRNLGYGVQTFSIY